ncbi:maltose regulon protein MalM [Actinobacillus seminis]|uniref:Maltose regulon periplasmic protein n=1 Tax=Actinobacillus seminis TaxID=722 RepID=A0A263HBP5_9PAST|nr:maltose operon protein MalM [Actinobacillus seminis]OZN24541.1 maltose regulon protein MalM [Actinobacillus seminis]SUU38615.1 maltose regulon periplasmic protein [Actinobacillus seminis]
MKKTFLTTALLLANMFIVSPSIANTGTPTYINSTELAQVQWQDVSFEQASKIMLTEQQKQAFTSQFAGIASPVAAYRIPANQGTVEIEIESQVLEDHVFLPTAVILDSQFNVAATYPSSEFKFQEEEGFKGNRFTANMNLTPAAGQDYLYLLVYTTQQDIAKTTLIPHPAKVYAKATGKQPPAINDIEVKHSLNGEVIVNASTSNGTKFIGLPTTIFSSNKTPAHPVGNVQPSAAANTGKALSAPVDKDTEAYFKQAVSKALKENDVNRALNLVNEAEKLGLSSPRKIFLQQVSSK